MYLFLTRSVWTLGQYNMLYFPVLYRSYSIDTRRLGRKLHRTRLYVPNCERRPFHVNPLQLE